MFGQVNQTIKKRGSIFFKVLLISVFLWSCIKDGKIDLNDIVDYIPPTITSIDISNNTLTVNGVNLHNIQNITLTDGTNNYAFAVNSQGISSLTAFAQQTTTLVVGTAYSLIISDALGQSQFNVTFQIPSGTVTAANLSQMGATDGQVLKWNNAGSVWAPANDISGVTTISRGTGLLNSGVDITSTGTIALDVGTTTGKIPQIGTVATGKVGIEISDTTNAALTLENSGQEFGIENDGSDMLFTDITGTSTNMAIKGNGSIGIGTTSVTTGAKLDVNGSMVATGTTGGFAQKGTHIDVEASDAANLISRVVAGNSGAGNNASLSFQVTNSGAVSEHMRITKDGNVGIGTASPSAKLEVSGSIRFGGRTFDQITYCANAAAPSVDNGNSYTFSAGNCDNGVPSGTCIGMIAKAAACGDDQDWIVCAPGLCGPGGMTWWIVTGTDCGNADIAAVFFCN